MQQKNKHSFLSLIHEYKKIVIPLIQREYAQGRYEEEGKIRSILDDIASVKKDSNVDLNFVYGYSDKDGAFVPLDGQQRLTLLFLLHYYFLICDNSKGEKKDKIIKDLESFSYNLRRATSLFLKRLIDPDNIESVKKLTEVQYPSKAIERLPWFFPQWKRDPSIRSMLRVLDLIHDKFKDHGDILDNLDNIQFSFFDVKSLGKHENFYIRINSRGKPLSEFENFRAGILSGIMKVKIDIEEDFKKNLDGLWTDIFWSIVIKKIDEDQKESNSGQNEHTDRSLIFDRYYLSLIKNILVNQVADKETNEILYRAITPSGLSLENLDDVKVWGEDDYKAIYYTLNMLSALLISEGNDINNFKNEYPYFYRLVTSGDRKQSNENKSIESAVGSYRELALLYSITIYSKEIELKSAEIECVELKLFKSWYRIIRNLVNNTNIEKKNYSDIQQNIQKLFHAWRPNRMGNKSSRSFTDYFADEREELRGFDKNQIEEEKGKANILKKYNNISNLIEKAEKNPYFSGQISYHLYLAEMPNLGELCNGDFSICSENWDKFENYTTKLDKIFGGGENGQDPKLKVRSNILWRRAVLAESILDRTGGNEFSYPCRYGNRYTFINNSPDNTDGWKYYLKKDENIQKFVKKILDDDHLFDYLTSGPQNDACESYETYKKLINGALGALVKVQPENGSEGQTKPDFRYWFLNEDFSNDGIFDKYISQTYWGVEFIGNVPKYLLMAGTKNTHYYEWNTLILYLTLKFERSEKDIFKDIKICPGHLNECKVTINKIGNNEIVVAYLLRVGDHDEGFYVDGERIESMEKTIEKVIKKVKDE